MKPIYRSKTFQKGEDVSEAIDFFYDNLKYENIETGDDIESNLKYKTIITITKVVEDEIKHEENG